MGSLSGWLSKWTNYHASYHIKMMLHPLKSYSPNGGGGGRGLPLLRLDECSSQYDRQIDGIGWGSNPQPPDCKAQYPNHGSPRPMLLIVTIL